MKVTKWDVLLVDPKGLIADSNSETFKRHLKYSEYLGHRNPEARLIILTYLRESKSVIYSSKFLVVVNYFDSSNKFLKKTRLSSLELEELNFTPKLLISGEPFETLLHVFALRKRLGDHIPIQLQIHFDPEQYRYGYGILGKIRYLITLFAILKCDSLRLVNKLQLRSVPRFLYRNKKITYSPLPISFSAYTERAFSINRPRNIGILGRIHPERGLDNVLRSIASLPSDSYKKIIVAGDGPLTDFFLEQLENLVGKKRLVYFGHLDEETKEEFWAKIGVLISFPQFEAYGMAMRESLCHGIPVIATRTIGSELLSSQCRDKEIQVLPDPFDPAEFIRCLALSFTKQIDDEFLNISRRNAEDDLNNLVLSWLKPTKY